MCMPLLRRPIAFLSVRCSIFVRCSILILLIKPFVVAFFAAVYPTVLVMAAASNKRETVRSVTQNISSIFVQLQQVNSSSCSFLLSITNSYDFIFEVLTAINMTLRSTGVWRIVMPKFQIKLMPETSSELSSFLYRITRPNISWKRV
jgi:hypothetical protein